MTRPQDNTLTLAQRLQALTLVEHGVSAKRVEEITEVSTRYISHSKKKARSRGYDPEISRVLKMEYVEDAPRSGQPSKVTPALEEAILIDVRKDRNGREDRPNTMVQEDKAPCHTSKHQVVVFIDFRVLRFLWPGNSPDLNMIEPCWPWMKRRTTLLRAPRSRREAEVA